jgi:two-component system, NarL family, sensor histidine kinase DevS
MAQTRGHGAGRDPMTGLCQAALALGAEHELQPVLKLILANAADLAGARYAALGVYDDAGQIRTFVHHGLDAATAARIGTPPRGNGLLGAAIVADAPIRIDDVRADPRSCGFPPHHPAMRTFLGVPIIRGGRRYGNLYLADKRDGGPFDRDDEQAIVTLAAFAAGAIQTAELIAAEREQAETAAALAAATQRQQLQDELRAATIAAQEAERARVARDLHDQVGQSLTSVLLALRLVARAVDQGLTGPGQIRQRIAETREMVAQALREVQAVASDLRPAVLDDFGLAAALERLAAGLSARHGIQIDLVSEGLDDGRRLQPEHEISTYRVVQEALTNAVRHAGAGRITVTATCADGVLRVAVDDDGAGFDPAAVAHRSLGLAGMRERLTLVGGALSVESRPGQGTRVVAEVPVG